MTAGLPAPRPCASCPYRRDAPSGVWAAEEYAKLARYDAETMLQPIDLFLCHQHDPDAARARICAGWLGCHGGDELAAVRWATAAGHITAEDSATVRTYASPVPLFGSGAEAAAHGLAALDTPGPVARQAIGKIERRRSHDRT